MALRAVRAGGGGSLAFAPCACHPGRGATKELSVWVLARERTESNEARRRESLSMSSLLCRFVSVIASGVAPWRSLRERQRVFSRCSPVLSLRATSRSHRGFFPHQPRRLGRLAPSARQSQVGVKHNVKFTSPRGSSFGGNLCRVDRSSTGMHGPGIKARRRVVVVRRRVVASLRRRVASSFRLRRRRIARAPSLPGPLVTASRTPTRKHQT